MSLLKSIGKALSGVAKKVLPMAAAAIPGVGPVTGAVLGGVASSVLSGRASRAPSLPALPGGAGGGMLPPIVRTAAPMAAAAAGGAMLAGWGDDHKPRRRRRKGITARDLSSFKRVARMVDKYSKPVHHFRNFKHSKGSI